MLYYTRRSDRRTFSSGGGRVSLSTLISGYYFCNLLAQGREIEQAIAPEGAELSSFAGRRGRSLFSLPRPVGYPLGAVLLLFILTYAAGVLPLLSTISAPPLVHAGLYFIPAIPFIFANLRATYLISRGRSAGLAWYGWVHQALFFLSIFTLARSLLAAESRHAAMGLIALLLVLLCRAVLNGRGFISFVLYARTQRIARLSRRLFASP